MHDADTRQRTRAIDMGRTTFCGEMGHVRMSLYIVPSCRPQRDVVNEQSCCNFSYRRKAKMQCRSMAERKYKRFGSTSFAASSVSDERFTKVSTSGLFVQAGGEARLRQLGHSIY